MMTGDIQKRRRPFPNATRVVRGELITSTMAPSKIASSEVASDASATGKSELLVADTFPSKAFLMVEHCDEEDSDVVCWGDDGTYFIVKDAVTLSTKYLPQYFKHSNFQSFVRQLNLYGFRTVRDKYDGSKTPGPAPSAFYHELFQHGRDDLLDNIKRSKTSRRKNPSHASEEKQADISHYDRRFDALEDQVAVLSRKLDLVLSLLSNTQGCASVPSHVAAGGAGGAKRRRRDARSPQGSENDVTAVSDDHSSESSTPSSPVVTKPRYAFNMAVVDELEIYESRSAEVQDAHCQHAANDNKDEAEADDDFKQYIDMMLSDDDVDMEQDAMGREHQHEPDENCSLAAMVSGADSAPDSLILVNDPLTSKVHPSTVEGEQQMPQTTASVVTVHAEPPGDVEFDEEAGVYDTSLPLTTAVEVNDDRPLRFTGTRIFIAVLILLVLVTAIVSPLVYFNIKEEKEENSRWPPNESDSGDSTRWPTPLESDEDDQNATTVDHDTNQTIFNSTGQRLQSSSRERGPLAFISSEPATRADPGHDFDFEFTIKGQKVQCILAP